MKKITMLSLFLVAGIMFFTGPTQAAIISIDFENLSQDTPVIDQYDSMGVHFRSDEDLLSGSPGMTSKGGAGFSGMALTASDYENGIFVFFDIPVYYVSAQVFKHVKKSEEEEKKVKEEEEKQKEEVEKEEKKEIEKTEKELEDKKKVAEKTKKEDLDTKKKEEIEEKEKEEETEKKEEEEAEKKKETDTIYLTAYSGSSLLGEDYVSAPTSWAELVVSSSSPISFVRFHSLVPFKIDDLAGKATHPLPEPGTLFLLGLGLFGLALRRRMKHFLFW